MRITFLGEMAKKLREGEGEGKEWGFVDEFWTC